MFADFFIKRPIFAAVCCIILTLAGGLIGLGLAYLAANGLAAVVKDYFPSFGLRNTTVLVGVGLMLAFGVITGLWPGLTAMRLKIVDALRRG